MQVDFRAQAGWKFKMESQGDWTGLGWAGLGAPVECGQNVLGIGGLPFMQKHAYWVPSNFIWWMLWKEPVNYVLPVPPLLPSYIDYSRTMHYQAMVALDN